VRDFVNLPGVNFIVPGLSAYSDLRPTPGPTPDGGFPAEVWGRARQTDNAFANVHLSANAGFLKDWVELAEAALQDCWTDSVPPMPSSR